MTKKLFFQKVIKDLLVSLIITYFLILIPELILPGLVSSHFSPTYLLVAILILGWLHARGTQKQAREESARFRTVSRNILNVVLFIVTIMLVLSLFKMKIWQIAVVTALSVALIVATENILIREE